MIWSVRFRNSALKYMRIALFWVITQPTRLFTTTRLVISRKSSVLEYTRWIKTIQNNKKSFLFDCLPLKTDALRIFETSGSNHQNMQRHIPEEPSLHHHRCHKLKSRFSGDVDKTSFYITQFSSIQKTTNCNYNTIII